MNPAELLPTLDPTPNPGPEWLFHGLLVLTFFLHLLFMNLALGGTLMAAVSQLFSGGRAGDARTVLAARMSSINSYAIAFTITTGIAPLLFVQVLYQQTFYPATILLGTAWLGLLAFLGFGYYSAYLYKFRGAPTKGAGGTLWLVLAAVLFLAVATIQVSVNLVHAQPELWTEIAASTRTVLSDPTWIVRFLHFVLGAVGLSAAVIAWWAVRKARQGEDPELNESIARYAWKWAVVAVFLQIVDGFLFLQLLPERVLVGLVSDLGTAIPLNLAILLALGLLLMLARVENPVERPGTATGVLGLMVTILAVMAITRHQTRILYLEPVSSQIEVASAPQWLNFGLFALLLVVALATVGWMIRAVVRNPATGAEAA